MLYILPKTCIYDLFQKLNKTSFLINFLLIIFNNKCFKTTSMQLAFLVEELNRYQKVMFYYIQYLMHFSLIIEVFKAVLIKKSYILYISIILSWFYSICLFQL